MKASDFTHSDKH